MNGCRAAIVVLAATLGALFVVGATAAPQAPTAGQAFKQVGKWGRQGTGNGQFNNVFGLAADKSGSIYAADSDNGRIQIFSAAGAFQGKIQLEEGIFVPDVAVDADGNVWGTTDTAVEARQYTRAGQSLATVTTPKGAVGVGADARGNIYVTTYGDEISAIVRYDKSGSQYTQGTSWGGFDAPRDAEVSPDGTIWVADYNALNVKRFDTNGNLLKTIGGFGGAPLGIGVDLDCNLWVTNLPQRRIDRLSPSGRLLGTAASPDLLAQDVVVGPTGDVYTYDLGTYSVIRFAEDKAKPATANIPGKLMATGKTVKIAYTLSGVACPATVDATATLSGPGIAGKAAGLKLKAGAKNTITMKLAKARSGKATFRIVLQTNGRPTIETRSVTMVKK